MKIAYFDCFSGASGDMILGALVDVGLYVRELNEEIRKLKIPIISLKTKRVQRGGIFGTQVIVEGKGNRKTHRSLKELFRIIDRSLLDPEIKGDTKNVLERIASVEAKIHKKPIEEVHFHEIGGLDSLVDIVGGIWGIKHLQIQKLYVSPVNVGSGFVKCEHGTLPVPAPATLLLMKGKPIYSSGVERELLTPTGAALLSFLGSEFGNMPRMRVEKVGYGVGKDNLPHPNLLRLMIGTSEVTGQQERVNIIETNIDDMNPQFYEYLMDRLLGMGALEVFLTPLIMKKNRPATLLTVLSSPQNLSSIVDFLMRETTTLGVRWREEVRNCAEREIIILKTKYGSIHFKMARWKGAWVNLSPEYEDCKRLALEQKVSLKEVYEEAKKTALLYQKVKIHSSRKSSIEK